MVSIICKEGISLNVNVDEFALSHRQYWQENFKLPDRLFPEEINEGQKMFGFLLDTDGVGASVHIFKWKSVCTYDETPA
jgi:hypothetical protein